MAICAIPDCDTHLGCRLRAKGIHLGAGATPTRTKRQSTKPKEPYNAWERGIVGEHRPGGGFMPYLSKEGGVMRTKELAEDRTQIESRLRELRSDPHVFAGTAGTTP